MKNIHKALFINLMMIGSLIAISSLSWLTVWIGLEMNLLALIPLMKHFNKMASSEAMMKYFMIQAMASAMLLFTVIIYTITVNFDITKLTTSISLLISSTLMLKMGMAPFHFWLPEVLSGLSWPLVFIILTWQKIAPMILLTNTLHNPQFISIIIIISSMIGSLMGLNQTCLRKILTYSSINHMSWMLSAMLNSPSIWLWYFLIYTLINLNIIIILANFNIYYMKELNSLFIFNKYLKILFMLNMLSLGGLPPLLGFFPKWITINSMISNNYITLAILLIIFTLMALYFYMRLTFTTFTLSTEKTLIKTFKKMNFFYFMVNILSIMGLMICSTPNNFM
uniref:NADH-ubiquinone oxidoreductase chain 2 n=1 Tax=Lepyrus sp. G312 TaxID=2480751 RepID=A0A3G2JZC3_9CUCU|nr:NADH dehydrogenase subunit 2 [Lepyrus sp. G312]